MTDLPNLRIFTRTEAISLLGLSARTWARLEARGETPPKIRLSAGRIGYAAGDLHKWVEARRPDEIPAPESGAKSTALYRHFNSDGRLLYVGISFSAIIRLGEHRSAPWFNDIARVEIERHPSRKAALAAEYAAIRDEKPLHNVRGSPASQALPHN